MSHTISFDDLKARLDSAFVLTRYGIALKGHGDQLSGYCPLPTHRSKAEKRRSPSFSLNSAKRVWQCFGCGARGNLLELAVRMEGLDPADGTALRSVAENLFHELGSPPREQGVRAKVDPAVDIPSATVVVNAPLTFTLTLDPTHPYLAARGLTAETIEAFGLGHCARGLLAGRIAIPIRNADGTLLAYAGRIVDEEAIDEEHPKYRFPGERSQRGVTHRFSKSEVVYNLDRVSRDAATVIVVEGFPSVWWMHQLAIPNTVAVMGSSMSTSQADLIMLRAPHARLVLIPDGDSGGALLTQSFLSNMAHRAWVRVVELADGCQPTDIHLDSPMHQFLCRA